MDGPAAPLDFLFTLDAAHQLLARHAPVPALKGCMPPHLTTHL